METAKKLCLALLFPHPAIMLILLPIATVLLVYSLVCLSSTSPLAIAAYGIAFYTLTVWCIRLPALIVRIRSFKRENRYLQIWSGDVRLRVRVSLYGALTWNTAYALLQLCLGLYHASVWYYALAVYYLCLALMRFFLSRHTTRHQPGEQMKKELTEYRTCGWIFLVINLALSAMVFLMICQNKTATHHQITTIALAAYTFTTLTTAIINAVRYRKYQSPVYSATKAISLAAACVSMITLTSTMLASFGDTATDPMFRTYMLAGLGAAVAICMTAMALYMIVQSTKKLNAMQAEDTHEPK